ncbi:MAG: hypothetical protein ABRQ37_23760 [Candidatus Eremiobacterota bacterium]
MDIQKYTEEILKEAIPLSETGLTGEQALNLRAGLNSYDWNAPGMEAYDELL